MRFAFKALLLCAAPLAIVGSADAATYTGPTRYFYLTGSYNASFRIDTGATIYDPDPSGFQLQDVVGNYPGSSNPNYADIVFYATGQGGGFEIDDPFVVGGTSLVVTDGEQIFGGTSSAPTFALRTFNLTEYQGSGTYQLTVSSTPISRAVPEPGTWALAILGFGAIGYTMRRSAREDAVRFAA